MSIEQLAKGEPTFWLNPQYGQEPKAGNASLLTMDALQEARARFAAYTPLLKRLFPDAFKSVDGIASAVQDVTDYFHETLKIGQEHSKIFLKMDSELPIAGSIKARGGIYEVLLHTEHIFTELGYADPLETILSMELDALKQTLSQYSILVGSTGNLGMSIGIMSAQLGYRVEVHMSKDAKAWKKDKLRQFGATVVEHAGDYSEAVDAARSISQTRTNAYFIDDENSLALFMGYAVAAFEVEAHLKALGITSTAEHPFAVVIPCGVGGAPGGICFGLQTLFKDAVHVYFVEPTGAPCMALGLMTGLHDQVSIEDYGIKLETIADGLAVGRPSKFAGQAIETWLKGLYTITDEQMRIHQRALYASEGIFVEPSSAAALEAPAIIKAPYTALFLWMTGGSLVPKDERERWIG